MVQTDFESTRTAASGPQSFKIKKQFHESLATKLIEIPGSGRSSGTGILSMNFIEVPEISLRETFKLTS